jgi:hypothetical protein
VRDFSILRVAEAGSRGAYNSGVNAHSGKTAWRKVAALAIALTADALQIGLLPLFVEGAVAPWNDTLDVAVGLALMALLGWHPVFLPAFVSELVPFLNLFPTWTASVIFVLTRRR